MGLARTRKQPEERKSELIETARRVFREKGYAATSVTDIVKEAGVSQGTFYFYFEDKEAVFDAVAETIVLEGYNVIRGSRREMTSPPWTRSSRPWVSFWPRRRSSVGPTKRRRGASATCATAWEG